MTAQHPSSSLRFNALVSLACFLMISCAVHARPPKTTPANADRRNLSVAIASGGFSSMLDPTISLAHPASERALSMLGVPYVWGGSSVTKGMDCSGFVLRSYQDATGLKLPRTALEMARKLSHVMPHQLRAGDLVFFNTRGRKFSHVGIYLGGSMFAHAPKPGHPSRMDSLEQSYWLSAFDGARRPATRMNTDKLVESFSLLPAMPRNPVLAPTRLDAAPYASSRIPALPGSYR